MGDSNKRGYHTADGGQANRVVAITAIGFEDYKVVIDYNKKPW